VELRYIHAHSYDLQRGREADRHTIDTFLQWKCRPATGPLAGVVIIGGSYSHGNLRRGTGADGPPECRRWLGATAEEGLQSRKPISEAIHISLEQIREE
jgi:hypothetical protein